MFGSMLSYMFTPICLHPLSLLYVYIEDGHVQKEVSGNGSSSCYCVACVMLKYQFISCFEAFFKKKESKYCDFHKM